MGASIMKRRHAFTLVELMVSMALIIFMMAILSGAFVAALGVFRNLKAQGDLAEKLRATSQILQNDLASYHFDGSRRLSDRDFWLNGPPTQGFFRIWQGSPDISAANALEGLDLPNSIPSYRSTNHYLAFTVRKIGNDMGDFMTAGPLGGGAVLSNLIAFGPNESRYQTTSGAGTYNYQWAEVAWFLQPQINPTTGAVDMTAPDVGTPNGVPLFTLYRRQRLLVPDNNLVVPPQSALTIQNFQEMSCWVNGGNIYFNNPEDITVPWRRFGMVAPGTTPSAPVGLLYATTGFPPSAWPLLVGQGGTWTLPSPTPPVPPTYPPSPTPPFLPPTPSYPTLAQQPGVPVRLYGADIQLNDVISFDVRVLAAQINPLTLTPIPIAPTFVSLLTPNPATKLPFFISYGNAAVQGVNPGQAYNPAYNMITGPMVFDTWTTMNNDLMGNNYRSSWANPFFITAIPMWNSLLNSGPLIQAIQISIRIWDFKTNQTRQVTIVQAM
jgi:type II secretory pathway pseudopilin PulG